MEEHSIHNEKELLRKISEGDEKAFNQLFDTFRLPIYAHILSIVKSPERAEEITQDIFIQVWTKRSELISIHSFADWLFVITRNRSLSELRKLLTATTSSPDENQVAYGDPLTTLLLKETSLLLQKAIDRLPARRKQIFVMSRIENKSHKEIAAALSITPGTVNLQLVQALASLRSFLYSAKKESKNFPGAYIYMLFIASLFI